MIRLQHFYYSYFSPRNIFVLHGLSGGNVLPETEAKVRLHIALYQQNKERKHIFKED